MLEEITPLVLTYDEGPNLERTLAPLTWARRVVVVDSGSTDDTLAICRRHPNVEVISRQFDGHTTQWNFGLDQVRTGWVLSLDADYVLTDELVAEMRALRPGPDSAGFFVRFTYCVFGRPLRGSLYPPRLMLFQRERSRYVDDGHTQKLDVRGQTGWLDGRVYHDDRKPVERWWRDQIRYAGLEARHLLHTPVEQLTRIDRLRRSTPFAPAVVLLYGLVWQRLLLDGWRGAYYAAQRTLAELLLLLLLLDVRLRGDASASR